MKIIVDLDGTLAKTNTFHQWTVASFLLPNRLHNKRPVVYLSNIMTFLVAYGFRACRVISHHQMKSRLISRFGRMAASMPSEDVHAFLDGFAQMIVSRHLNEEVRNAINDFTKSRQSNDDEIALATAAPSLYADVIAASLGFRCFATQIPIQALIADPDMTWEDNRSEAKLESVSPWLGSSTFVMFTDHIDDWPLIERSNSVFLVRPNQDLLRRVQSLSKSFTLMS